MLSPTLKIKEVYMHESRRVAVSKLHEIRQSCDHQHMHERFTPIKTKASQDASTLPCSNLKMHGIRSSLNQKRVYERFALMNPMLMNRAVYSHVLRVYSRHLCPSAHSTMSKNLKKKLLLSIKSSIDKILKLSKSGKTDISKRNES